MANLCKSDLLMLLFLKGPFLVVIFSDNALMTRVLVILPMLLSFVNLFVLLTFSSAFDNYFPS